jgi:DNA-binding CsgD family transcriptional regulator
VKSEYEKQMEISQLKAEQQLKRYRLYLGVALLAMTLLVVIVLVLRYRKNKELEALKSREAQLRLQGALEKATLHSWQVLQQQALAIYQSEQKDKLKQILEAFDKAYPQAKKKLQTVCPDLSETERNLAILTLLRFRSKEEANLLNLSENTVRKYRSTLNKKLDFNLFSDLVG